MIIKDHRNSDLATQVFLTNLGDVCQYGKNIFIRLQTSGSLVEMLNIKTKRVERINEITPVTVLKAELHILG